jgi:ketosteroid isomerase-like protein
MSENRNIDLACRLLAALETGADENAEQLVHPAHRDHSATDLSSGAGGVRESIRRLRDAFSPAPMTIEDVIASGDRVVIRLRLSATGRRPEADEVHIWRIADGRLAEHWMVHSDLVPAMREID